MATRMLQRRGTAAEWTAQNPVLGDGEFGYERDTKNFKIGDGVTAWNDLVYSNITRTVRTTAVDQVGFIIDAIAGTDVNLFEANVGGVTQAWIGPDGTIRTINDIHAAGAAFVGNAGYYNATLNALARAGEVAAVIRGAAGQDILQVQNSAGGWVGSWNAAGLLIANVGFHADNAGNGVVSPLYVENSGGNTNTVVAIIKATAGQIGDIIQAQDGAGVKKAWVDGTGGIHTVLGMYAGAGLYNSSAEAIILGYGGANGRLRISDDGAAILYFQHDREVHFTPPFSSTNRKRIRTNDYATTTNFNGGVTTDWSWPTYLDSGEDSQWRITDGWGYYRGRILTNAGGPYADPLAVYLPFNLTGSYAADRNSWRNGRVVGRYVYMRNDGSATYEGVLVRVGAQANTVNAIYNNALLSLQPGQYDRLHVEIHAPTAS